MKSYKVVFWMTFVLFLIMTPLVINEFVQDGTMNFAYFALFLP